MAQDEPAWKQRQNIEKAVNQANRDNIVGQDIANRLQVEANQQSAQTNEALNSIERRQQETNKVLGNIEDRVREGNENTRLLLQVADRSNDLIRGLARVTSDGFEKVQENLRTQIEYQYAEFLQSEAGRKYQAWLPKAQESLTIFRDRTEKMRAARVADIRERARKELVRQPELTDPNIAQSKTQSLPNAPVLYKPQHQQIQSFNYDKSHTRGHYALRTIIAIAIFIGVSVGVNIFPNGVVGNLLVIIGLIDFFAMFIYGLLWWGAPFVGKIARKLAVRSYNKKVRKLRTANAIKDSESKANYDRAVEEYRGQVALIKNRNNEIIVQKKKLQESRDLFYHALDNMYPPETAWADEQTVGRIGEIARIIANAYQHPSQVMNLPSPELPEISRDLSKYPEDAVNMRACLTTLQ